MYIYSNVCTQCCTQVHSVENEMSMHNKSHHVFHSLAFTLNSADVHGTRFKPLHLQLKCICIQYYAIV